MAEAAAAPGFGLIPVVPPRAGRIYPRMGIAKNNYLTKKIGAYRAWKQPCQSRCLYFATVDAVRRSAMGLTGVIRLGRGKGKAALASSWTCRVTETEENRAIPQQRTVITNKYGEKLVGILHETGSRELVILCHGFRSSKEDKTILNLAAALTKEGISVFRFDFAGNGESEGSFQYGNYRKEADDLWAVVVHFTKEKREISAISGHSKGGNVVLLYASMYRDIHTVINISGRFALDRGIEGRLGKDFLQRIKRDGFIDVKDKTGQIEYRVTEESLMDRLSTDMHSASLAIDKECRVLTIHGSVDEIVPAEDALEFSKLIPNHKLHVMEGANHSYTRHQDELASLILNFIRSDKVGDASARGDA